MPSVCRIACVRIGRFATGALAPARSDEPPGDPPSTAEAPFVLVAEDRNRLRVVAVNAAAAQNGIEPGTPLEGAQALVAGLRHRRWSDEELSRAALRVTTALLVCSPRVHWAGRDAIRRSDYPTIRLGCWWIDAAGLGDEQRLAQKLLRTAKELDLGPVHVGVADSAITAYAATFRSPLAKRPRLTACVPSGRDAAFLAPFPMSLLELDEDLADTLRALGLLTVGSLARLDPDEVEARFGPPGLAAHRLARGQDDRGPSRPRDDALPQIECDLGAAVATAEPLMFVLKGAASALGAALRDKGLAAREIVITLSLDNGTLAERSARPARPTSHEAALFDHARALFDDWQLPEPVTAITLRAGDTVAAAGEQGSLLVARWADPAALDAAFERIRAREGADAVAVAETRDGHLPADAGAWRTSAQADKRTNTASVRWCAHALVPQAALRIIDPPTSIRVRMGRAGLEAFRSGEQWHDLAAWSGPEHLAPRWWRDVEGGARDYFTARTREGTCCLLYRTGKQPRWFLEGYWD